MCIRDRSRDTNTALLLTMSQWAMDLLLGMGPWSAGEGTVSVGGLMFEGTIILSSMGTSSLISRGSGGAGAAYTTSGGLHVVQTDLLWATGKLVKHGLIAVCRRKGSATNTHSRGVHKSKKI